MKALFFKIVIVIRMNNSIFQQSLYMSSSFKSTLGNDSSWFSLKTSSLASRLKKIMRVQNKIINLKYISIKQSLCNKLWDSHSSPSLVTGWISVMVFVFKPRTRILVDIVRGWVFIFLQFWIVIIWIHYIFEITTVNQQYWQQQQ